MKLFKNKRGSELVEKTIMVAFSVFMGAAVIFYAMKVINQNKTVNIRSGIQSVETQRVIRNETEIQSGGWSNVKRYMTHFMSLNPNKIEEVMTNENKCYFTQEYFVYFDENGTHELNYNGGFDGLFNYNEWTKNGICNYFNVEDITDQGNILIYNGNEYDYSWEPSGTAKTKDEVAPNKLYTVTLTAVPSNKRIATIKIVRAYTGEGLKDAKDDITELPRVICEKWLGNEILPMCNELDGVGATYEIVTA